MLTAPPRPRTLFRSGQGNGREKRTFGIPLFFPGKRLSCFLPQPHDAANSGEKSFLLYSPQHLFSLQSLSFSLSVGGGVFLLPCSK